MDSFFSLFHSPLILIAAIAALAFDFVNGFHDAANSIATVVSTRVLSPRLAVAWAAFFNFAAVFAFGVSVAMTVGKGVVHTNLVTVPVILSGLVGAIAWNLITWWLGLPSSSSHALVGGYAGAALAFKGTAMLIPSGLIKVAVFIVVSPIVGAGLGLLAHLVVERLAARGAPQRMTKRFKRLQLLSAAVYSFSHGTNDAQKTMGIIFALLVAGGSVAPKDPMPIWIIFACYTMIAAGTLFGGFRIVKTMGMRLTKLAPMQGFCAETGGGVTILAVSALGIPVSTTHTITGAIVGVGVANRIRSVRWMVAGRILWAWLLTIPMAALIAALFWYAAGQFL
ncbi:MAG: inorganic phosphate transporter [Deltaproteobacteria bacterium]|nr:inorganic phosphate transporter [Deltaproteobacteria bacterium]